MLMFFAKRYAAQKAYMSALGPATSQELGMMFHMSLIRFMDKDWSQFPVVSSWPREHCDVVLYPVFVVEEYCLSSEITKCVELE